MTSKENKLNFFSFLTEINAGKRGKDLLSESTADKSVGGDIVNSPDKAYLPFMVNRGLSYFQDTILFANEMNKHAHLPHKMQFDFLRFGVSPRKRFSKWAKKPANSDDVEMIMEKYDYSSEKANDALTLFTEDALKELRIKMNKGGLKK